MDHYRHILLASDGLSTSAATTETAFRLAQRHNAKVTIVDTLQRPSKSSRWFSTNADDVFEMVLADKTARLDSFANKFCDAGVDAVAKVLIGRSSESIIQEAEAEQVDLVVRYMKGAQSKFAGMVGNTARALLRSSPCPLLLVGSQPVDDATVLAMVDVEHDDSENQAILNEAIRFSSQQRRLRGAYCWDLYDADLMKKRMGSAAYQDTIGQAKAVYQSLFDKFAASHDLTAFGDSFQVKQGFAATAIPELCQEHSVNVVVMCTVSLNRLMNQFLGSTVEAVVDSLPCALLAVKPIGFQSESK